MYNIVRMVTISMMKKFKRILLRHKKRTFKKSNLDRIIVRAYKLNDDIFVDAKAKEIVNAINAGKTAISVYMGHYGETTVDRLRAVIAVKMALEDPSIIDLKYSVLRNIRVKFKENPYAGESYLNTIKCEEITSSQIRTHLQN